MSTTRTLPRLLLSIACCAALAGSDARAGASRAAAPGAPVPATLLLPAPDIARALAEDAAAGKSAPLRVGLPVPCGRTPREFGTWEELGDGSRVWRARVTSAGARWLVLGFDRLRLVPGAALRVHDPSGRAVLGPYGTRDAGPQGGLWLPPLSGDSAVIELFWPGPARETAPDLRLATVAHGYRPLWGVGGEPGPFEPPPSTDAAGACNVDVNCPMSEPWQDAKRGVVQLLVAGQTVCSGSLVNTTALDCRPYVLTARHCVADGATAAATLFRFNYENPLCEAGPPAAGQITSGASLRATHPDSDFALLELAQALPADAEPYFNGWSRMPSPPAEAWTIHHPVGGAKKISHDLGPVISGQASGWGDDHWRIVDWESGTTEPGSSGAPLFDPDGRIVGQLHGGTASCLSKTWDEFGKLAVSWAGGGTSWTRLSDWLDPLGTGAVALGGLDAQSCRWLQQPPAERLRPLRPAFRAPALPLRRQGPPAH